MRSLRLCFQSVRNVPESGLWDLMTAEGLYSCQQTIPSPLSVTSPHLHILLVQVIEGSVWYPTNHATHGAANHPHSSQSHSSLRVCVRYTDKPVCQEALKIAQTIRIVRETHMSAHSKPKEYGCQRKKKPFCNYNWPPLPPTIDRDDIKHLICDFKCNEMIEKPGNCCN